MKHVFVETNWVFDACAPEPFRTPEACDLLTRAASAEIQLHVPAICLREAADALRYKYGKMARTFAPLLEFRRWSARGGLLTSEQVVAVDHLFDGFTKTIRDWDSHGLETRLSELRQTPGIEFFPLTQPMLERAIELRKEVHDLPNAPFKPFDEAILAAVLVRARELRDAGELHLFFCELDIDLHSHKGGTVRSGCLAGLYMSLGLELRHDFSVP